MGKGARRDNRMIERLWQSLKYDCAYLNASETGSDVCARVGKSLTSYDSERPRSTNGSLPPDEAYDSKKEPLSSAIKMNP
ncbi:MAG: integrase core domain-containing protein [Paracoccaceae bacterium]